MGEREREREIEKEREKKSERENLNFHFGLISILQWLQLGRTFLFTWSLKFNNRIITQA